MQFLSSFRLWCFLVWLLPVLVFAQRGSLVSRDSLRPNNLNIGISYGEIIEKRDAYFYGVAIEYGRKLNNAPLGLGVAMMWDSETDRNKFDAIETITGALTASYLISDRFSLATGLAKGFIDDDNPQRIYKFTNGDWSTGLIAAYVIPTGQASFIGITSSIEYNISQKEFSFSLDLSYALNW